MPGDVQSPQTNPKFSTMLLNSSRLQPEPSETSEPNQLRGVSLLVDVAIISAFCALHRSPSLPKGSLASLAHRAFLSGMSDTGICCCNYQSRTHGSYLLLIVHRPNCSCSLSRRSNEHWGEQALHPRSPQLHSNCWLWPQLTKPHPYSYD